MVALHPPLQREDLIGESVHGAWGRESTPVSIEVLDVIALIQDTVSSDRNVGSPLGLAKQVVLQCVVDPHGPVSQPQRCFEPCRRLVLKRLGSRPLERKWHTWCR